LPKFSFEKTVNAKRESVFEIFSNFENYQKLFPQHFPSVRTRSVRNDVSVVEEHLILGDKELLIMAKHVSKTPVLHEVFIIGGDGKGSHIQEQFISVLDGTKILVDVNLKLKGKMKILGLFGKRRLEQDYEQILNDFIKTAKLV